MSNTTVEHTARGFELIEFTDYNEQECSLQQSSLALFEQPGAGAVWLGVTDAKIKTCVMGEGWKDIELPEGASVFSRMHLSHEQVQELVTRLQNWLDTGSFENQGAT